jgi:aspartyl-tRNA(Asn)/glutamyl-tRNA(Gln) amidotransferase subunit C
MSFEDRDIEHIAELARLRLDDVEKRRLAVELARIVEFIEQLAAVDVDGVPPTKHVIDLDNVARDDAEGDCLTAEEALANAPDADAGHFVVPKYFVP